MSDSKLPPEVQTPNIATDPEQARTMFKGICQMSAANDPTAQWMLQALIESVMVDHISNWMATDEEFALVIGRRAQMLVKAVMDKQVRDRMERGIRKADAA